MDQYELIRTGCRVYGQNISEMSRMTGHSRNTIKKAIRGEPWGYKERAHQPFPVLNKYMTVIDGWLTSDKSSPKKQQHMARRVRFGEIAVLTWSCWNREAGTLTILNAKTGSRTAYLTERAKEMLQVRKKAREAAAKKAGKEVKPDELIFPKRTREGGVAVQASKVFADTVKELGFNQGVTDRKQRVTFHTLRHSFATHLYESTHDLYLTQRSLGHATGAMTARYAKMSESRLREGAATLEKTFAANGKVEEDTEASVG